MEKTCTVQHQVYEGQYIQLFMLMTAQFWIANSVNFIILRHLVLKKYYLNSKSSECIGLSRLSSVLLKVFTI